MEELIQKASMWEYEVDAGFNPQDRELASFINEDRPQVENNRESEDVMENHRNEPYEARDKKASGGRKESPILVAAMKGVEEMVEKILDTHPVAIRDVNQDGKNVVLLAVENRQPNVYQLLCERLFASVNSASRKVSAYQIANAFAKVDDEGNSVRHLVSTSSTYKPGLISGAFLQMLWEIKWYKFVKKSMPRDLFVRLNNKGQTAKEAFIEKHKDLTKEARKWLKDTSNSCSLIAALIATAAFATVTAVPDEVQGEPTLKVFAIASLTALFFSIASLFVFLAIIIYDYEKAGRLTAKLIFGLNSLIISIASMLISFFASLSLVLKGHLRNIATFHVYTIPSCLLITLFMIVFLPLYEFVMISYFFNVPLRTYERHVSLISSIN